METKSLYPVIVTDKMDETIKFYSDLMNFKVKHYAFRKDGGRVVVLANQMDFQIELMEPIKEAPVKLENGLYGFRMNVDDFDEAYRDVVNQGCTIMAGPLETPTAKSVIIKDVNGTKITIMKHIKK